MGWGSFSGIQPSPITYYLFNFEILNRLILGISGSMRFVGQVFTFIREEVQV
jgi:hypothetical protein